LGVECGLTENVTQPPKPFRYSSFSLDTGQWT